MMTDEEAFDEALDRRVWSLSDQRLKWDLELALKRRETPKAIEELMESVGREEDEREGERMRMKEVAMDLEEGGSTAEGTYICIG